MAAKKVFMRSEPGNHGTRVAPEGLDKVMVGGESEAEVDEEPDGLLAMTSKR